MLFMHTSYFSKMYIEDLLKHDHLCKLCHAYLLGSASVEPGLPRPFLINIMLSCMPQNRYQSSDQDMRKALSRTSRAGRLPMTFESLTLHGGAEFRGDDVTPGQTQQGFVSTKIV